MKMGLSWVRFAVRVVETTGGFRVVVRFGAHDFSGVRIYLRRSEAERLAEQVVRMEERGRAEARRGVVGVGR